MSVALAQLVVLEAQQVEQLADTRAAIAAIERVSGRMPTPPAATVPAAVKSARRPRESGAPEGVQRVLRDGPLLVAEFLKKTKLSRYQAQQLVKRGVVVATGTTNSRRYGLPGSPAKEAP